MGDNLETTIGAFEKRMSLRRRMLRTTGVQMPPNPTTLDDETLIRDSVVNCMECKSADYCALWLEAVDPGVDPPAFCPNAKAIKELSGTEFAG